MYLQRFSSVNSFFGSVLVQYCYTPNSNVAGYSFFILKPYSVALFSDNTNEDADYNPREDDSNV